MKILDTGEIIYENQYEKQIICTHGDVGVPLIENNDKCGDIEKFNKMRINAIKKNWKKHFPPNQQTGGQNKRSK